MCRVDDAKVEREREGDVPASFHSATFLLNVRQHKIAEAANRHLSVFFYRATIAKFLYNLCSILALRADWQAGELASTCC